MPRTSRRKALLVELATWLMLLQCLSRDYGDHHNCDSLLDYGRWTQNPDKQYSHNAWNPTSCMLHTFEAHSLRTCLEYTPIHFVGDSTARELFWATAAILDPDKVFNSSAQISKHSNISFPTDVKLHFTWNPFLDRVALTEGPHILAAGLWYLKNLDENLEFAGNKLRAIDRHMQILNAGNSHDGDRWGIFLPVRTPVYEWLNGARSRYITPSNVLNLNDDIMNLSMSCIEVAWSTGYMTAGHRHMFMEDGIHYTPEVARLQANLLLNRICNPILMKHGHNLKSSCCMEYRHSRIQIALVVVCSAAVLLWLLRTAAIRLATRDREDKESTEIDEQPYNHLLMFKVAGVMGATLVYCFAADRSMLFEKTNKVVNVNMFVALVACCYVIGLRTIKTIPQSDLSDQASFLSRAQTEEWKGWMQAIVLLYHYFGMSQVLWVYKIVRVLVGAYLLLTGYGHAMYFEQTADFTLRRVAGVLLRLNLLSWALALMMNTTWDFYYFAPLSSFWFLITYITMYRPGRTRGKVVWSYASILLSALLMTVILKRAPEILHQTIRAVFAEAKSDSTTDRIQEFIFRVSLDVYGPYAGMVLAVIQKTTGPRLVHLFRRRLVHVASTAFALFSIVWYAYFALRFTNKVTYNTWHPVISLVPILSYIVLRNNTKYLRFRYSTGFAWLGRCSLETFILQYHIWLAVDTKGTLHMGRFVEPPAGAYPVIASLASWPYWIQKATITLVFLQTSNAVASASSLITAAFIGKRR